MINQNKKQIGIILVATLTAVYSALYLLPVRKVADKKVLNGSDTRVAHRCGRGIFPENTIFACKKILDSNLAGFLEMDFHLTKDKVPVVIHDFTVDRTTNGKGEIANLNYSELEGLDAGYKFTPDEGKTFPYRGKSVKIGKLEEFFQSFPNKNLMVEVKPNSEYAADQLLGMIQKYGREDSVIVGSFHQEIKDYLFKKNPNLAFFASKSEVTIWYLLSKVGLSHIYKMKSHVLAVPLKAGIFELNNSLLEKAHSQNLKVYVWTINDEPTMKLLLDMGVDGIMTDDPILLTQLTKK
jgi:glycerophosphoryl diester phosphodiesterase